MTNPGDLYRRRGYMDHVLITKVIPYREGVWQFYWRVLESGECGTYVNPWGDTLPREIFYPVE